MTKSLTVIPGILARSKEDFAEKLAVLESLKPPRIQVDLADGLAVPNRTLSLADIQSVPSTISQTLHLMVLNPHQVVPQIQDSGVITEIIFHLDWEQKPYLVFDYATEKNISVSIALTPVMNETVGVADIAPFVSMLSSVVVLAVVPGFSGQPFRENVLTTIFHLKKEYPQLPIGVDGGMNPETVAKVAQAGASIIYATSYILRSPQPQVALEELQATA